MSNEMPFILENFRRVLTRIPTFFVRSENIREGRGVIVEGWKEF